MLPSVFVKLLFALGVFTVSFDILFVINVGPNFRVSQIFISILVFHSLVNHIYKKSTLPIGAISLLIWAYFIILFIPNSGFIPKGVGYAMWLLFNIATVFSFVQLISSPNDLRFYIPCYIYSFVFVAMFGLMQFFGGIFGFGELLLVETWWIPGLLPRINGFSYEPSFFATYLIIGWVMVSYFIKNRIYYISNKKLKFCFFILTLALCLSGSRLGVFFMGIWYLQYPAFSLLKLILFRGNHKDFIALFISFVFLLLIFFIYNLFASSELFQILAFGIGLEGTSSHSIDERVGGFSGLLDIFQNSPFIGYSLGGLSYALGIQEGVSVNDFNTAKLEGNGVFLEVLAASGIFGFIPFCIYIFNICLSPFYLASKIDNIKLAGLLKGLGFSLIFELAIIQPNQNILRPYLWLHIAMLTAVYSIVDKVKSTEKN
jgi:hypothetical protein